MAIGLRFTKPGKDISSTDPRDFTIHSDYNILKVAEEGYGSFGAVAGGEQTVDISHNLGYKPIVWYYGYHPELDRWCMATSRLDNISGYNISWGFTHLNNNTVRLSCSTYCNLIGGCSVLNEAYYKYYILIEPRKDAWYE